MGATSSQETFGVWLEQRLSERGWGNRTLAARMENDPQKAEQLRRTLIRYRQDKHLPTMPMVYAIADALGVSRDEAEAVARPERREPASDDDEEEEVAATLMGALRKVLRHPEVRRLVREVVAEGLA